MSESVKELERELEIFKRAAIIYAELADDLAMWFSEELMSQIDDGERDDDGSAVASFSMTPIPAHIFETVARLEKGNIVAEIRANMKDK